MYVIGRFDRQIKYISKLTKVHNNTFTHVYTFTTKMPPKRAAMTDEAKEKAFSDWKESPDF